MKTKNVTVVRLYMEEDKAHLEALLEQLRDAAIHGVTAFRGIAGIGDSGELHMARLIDTSLELPLVVEFFDAPERIAAVMETIESRIKPGHILMWDARINAE